MRWTKSLLALSLVTMPLLLNAQTRGEEGAGNGGAEIAQPAAPAPAQPTVRKSLMGMVMGALIDSAERKQRQEALARGARTEVNEPDVRPGSETPSLATQAPVAQEPAPKESVALQVDDIP